MDKDNLDLAVSLISKGYINQGQQALRKRQKLVKTLLSERRLPKDGWDDPTIETLIQVLYSSRTLPYYFRQDLAAMDSNNFLGNIGVGEREGRIVSSLVAKRHYHMGHGIGRSGDISAEQPKAAGSSLMAKLTALLAADALRLAGLVDLAPLLILPLATGMALTMTLLSLRSLRPQQVDHLFTPLIEFLIQAKYVIWPRIDQKTCLKCIVSANLVPVVVDNLLTGDYLTTDTAAIENKIKELGEDNVVCVMSTTSCFAPRGCDDVAEIAALCRRINLPHIVNNAYGVQSSFLCKEISSAMRNGRVDALVQSTDKNFMVPVGGSIVACPSNRTELLNALNKSYPGRASGSVHLDLFITLLHLGSSRWTQILQKREDLYDYAIKEWRAVAAKLGEYLVVHPRNPISIAMTLDNLSTKIQDVTFLGSKLFTKFVSGTRVVSPGRSLDVGGVHFDSYGGHHESYPHHYVTAAVALGTEKADIDRFLDKLTTVYLELATRT